MSSFGQDLKVKPKIAIIGGSGLCEFPELSVIESLNISTPYGEPSNDIVIGKCGENVVAFLPRHGRKHNLPPHKVPYKANIYALKKIGIECIVGTCIAGSLRPEIVPGSIVIIDQFINFTWGRDDYFEADGRQFIHLPMAMPYCKSLRKILIDASETLGLRVFSNGTVVVIQGPRFSTIAESKMFSLLGGDIINMTQYPECYFARELGMCYGAIAAITDYDVGIPDAISMQPNSMETVLKIFRGNISKTTQLLIRVLNTLKGKESCNCADTQLKEYYKKADQ